MDHIQTIVTDSASAESCRKGFLVSDAMAKSEFGYKDLAKMGFTCDAAALKMAMDTVPGYKEAITAFAQDAGLELGEANIDALGQFFTLFNEQTINVLYRGRTAAQTFGVKTMGDWTTERIAFKLRELTGSTSLYDDWSRAAYAAYNYGWDTRDTVRLEWALEVTKLEEAVASVMRRNAYKDKKDAIVLEQSIFTNEFFWNGLSLAKNGATWNKKLYGVLNEPNIASAGRKSNLPIDPGSATITVDEMCAALRTIKQEFITDLQGNGDVDSMPIELACPIAWQSAFTVPNTVTGYTAYKWMAENWSNAKVSFKPELDTADDGEPMMIVFAKSVPGVGMDTINLIETSKLHLIGAMLSLKGREEAYSASLAGAICAAPLGVKFWAAGGESSGS